jgi:hypothetical protein
MAEKKRQKKAGQDTNKKNQRMRRRTPAAKGSRGSARQRDIAT